MIKMSCYKKILVYGIFILLIGAGVVPSISGYTKKISIQSTSEAPTSFPLNDDYVNVYWKFDECSGNTLGDSSGHNYDGIINGATWTTGGYSGCALVFDGVDDYVDLTSHSAEIGVNKTDDLIISFYFNSTGEGIIYSATAPWGYSPEFRIELLSNGSLLFKVETQLCGITLYSNGTYDNGDWHHAEYYYNGITSNPTVTLYVDNNYDVSVTRWLCEIENDDFALTKIGMHAHDSTDYYNGVIDEFKIIKYEQGNEQKPPTIDGPTIGLPDIEYDYTFVTNDPEGDNISLYIDWDDDDPDEWIGPYESGEEVIVSHKWDEDGKYNITARSKDIWHHSRWSEKYVVRIGNQPPDAPTIDGPECGDPGVEYTYTFVAEDLEGHNVSYYVDWGDGTFDDWFGPFPSGEEATASHAWDFEGDYEITVKAKDEYDKEGEWSMPYLVRMGDQVPEAPDIDGPPSGNAGVEYHYTFVTTDPDGDNVIYEIKWGDVTSDEKGPYPSGEEVIVSHAWEKSGTYLIEARARDEFCGFYGNWSEFEVTIPRNKVFNFNFDLLGWLFEQFPNAFPILRQIMGL